MNSSHIELQIMFSAEDVGMEIQALADWSLLGHIGALYFGIKPVSILLRELFAVSVKKKPGLYLRKQDQIQCTFKTLQKIFHALMG